MKQLYRLALCCLFAAAGLSGCQPMNKILGQPSRTALATRLPALELSTDAGPLTADEGARPEDLEQLFERDVRMNFSDPEDSARYGYATLLVRETATARTGRGVQLLQLFTMMTPALVGVPLEWYETQLTAQVRILDVRGQELAAYTGTGAGRIRVALYHGYSQVDAPRLAQVAALREALTHIKRQLDTDAPRLREKLLSQEPLLAHRLRLAPVQPVQAAR